VLTAVTLGATLQRWAMRRPAGSAWRVVRSLALGALSLGVFASLVQNLLIVREFSRTGFPAIEAAFQEAAQMGRPVRYFGNEWGLSGKLCG
jgi:hypothetical protein